MRVFIDDLIDLVRGRVKPIEHYQYPFWQSLLVLALLGIVAAPSASSIPGPIEGKVLFFVMVTCLQAALLARFMGWWLKQAGWGEQRPLFGLVALSNAPKFLIPLTSWLSPVAAVSVQVALWLVCIVVQINSFALVSGRSRLRVLMGMLLFSPLEFALLLSCIMVGMSQGWIDIPADMPAAVQGASSGAASSAL